MDDFRLLNQRPETLEPPGDADMIVVTFTEGQNDKFVQEVRATPLRQSLGAVLVGADDT